MERNACNLCIWRRLGDSDKDLAPVAGRLSGQHHHSTRTTDAGVCLGANHGESKSIGYNSVVSVVNAE